MATAPTDGREDGYEHLVGLRRAHPSLLPASGAWRDGDPLGERQLLSLGDRAFALEGGGVLRDVTLDYGDFRLKGELEKLETFAKPTCD